jgi:hypothetical protein
MPQGLAAISIRRFSIVEKIDFFGARTDKAAMSGAQRNISATMARRAKNTARLLPFSESHIALGGSEVLVTRVGVKVINGHAADGIDLDLGALPLPSRHIAFLPARHH